MSFYRKPVWWCHRVGVEFCNSKVTIHFWNWIWEPGRKRPNFGDCVLGIVFGEKPTKRTGKSLKMIKTLTGLAERVLKGDEK